MSDPTPPPDDVTPAAKLPLESGDSDDGGAEGVAATPTPTAGSEPGDDVTNEPPLPPPPDPSSPARDPEDEARRKLLMFIIGGSAAAAILLAVGLWLLLKPSDTTLSSTPTTSAAAQSTATLALIPSGNIPEGTTVTAMINLVSTMQFRSAVITVDGAQVAQTSSPNDPLTFTPPAGKHVAVGRVTLQNGEEVVTPPVEFTVGNSPSTRGPGSSASTPASSASTSTASSATTSTTEAPIGPIQAGGVSTEGIKPLRFGDAQDESASIVGEKLTNDCPVIAPVYSGGKANTFFGFPGGKFTYFGTFNPEWSTTEGAKVGMTAEEVKSLVTGLTEKPGPAPYTLLVKKSQDATNELVFWVGGDGKVVLLASSTGELAEAKQCG